MHKNSKNMGALCRMEPYFLLTVCQAKRCASRCVHFPHCGNTDGFKKIEGGACQPDSKHASARVTSSAGERRIGEGRNFQSLLARQHFAVFATKRWNSGSPSSKDSTEGAHFVVSERDREFKRALGRVTREVNLSLATKKQRTNRRLLPNRLHLHSGNAAVQVLQIRRVNINNDVPLCRPLLAGCENGSHRPWDDGPQTFFDVFAVFDWVSSVGLGAPTGQKKVIHGRMIFHA